MGIRLPSLASIVIGGSFGLAIARAALDAWPSLAGPLPRLPLALLSALAFAAAGYGLHRKTLPLFSFLPLLIPAAALFIPTVNPVRDWILVLGGLGGLLATQLTHPPSTLLREAPPSGRTGLTTRLPDYLTPRLLFPLSLVLITALLYFRTLAPTVGEADTFEFQVNVLRLGISHGSGYPLYILLAKLFSLLPLGGTAAFRINLSSAFFGVTASLVAYALARTLDASRPASWIAALSLAASIGLWSRAVEAEVYTLHVTLVGLLLLVAIRSQESGASIQKATFFLAPLFGLSLTNHLTTALLLPALATAAISSFIIHTCPAPSRAPRERGRGRCKPALPGRPGCQGRSYFTFRPWFVIRHSSFVILLFALGLSVYLYLPIRWPAVNHGEIMTWDMFQHFITGQEAQGALRLDAWYTDLGRYAIVGRKALDQFGWVGASTALVGLVALFRKRPSAAAITLAAYGAYALFGLSFYVPDPDYSSFLLPAHLVQAVWMAAGIQAVADIASRLTAKTQGHEAARSDIVHSSLIIVYCCFFFLPASLIWRNLPLVDQSNDWRAYRRGQYILSQPLKEGATILADSELIAPLYYLQVAEGVRPDLDIVVLPDEAAYRAELDARISNGKTVYLGRYLPHLADVYYLGSVGPLTEARLEPGTLPGGITPPGQNFVGAIRLLGLTLDSITASADDALRLTLYWQAVEPPLGNYLVTLRLVDSGGMPVLIGPAQVPVGQMYPTAAWPTNDVVADFHSFALDPALEPGRYFLQVGLFPPFSQEGLRLESGGSWLTLADVTLTDPTSEPKIPFLTRMRFGEAWLLGYDAPPNAAPGSNAAVTLYWQSAHATTAQLCAEERCETVKVRAGKEVTQARVEFPVPNQAGDLTLRVGVPGENAECAWFAPQPAESCQLTRIAAEGAALAANAINFDNKIVLDKLEVETGATTPGGTVIVTAQWRGLRPMEADYTAFVHLLGPDGIVHGQVDTWPAQGTQPTSQWSTNQPILDRFEVHVPDDAPRGRYTVEVGWYLLATLDRLPVVNVEGVAIDDRYVVSGLEIR